MKKVRDSQAPAITQLFEQARQLHQQQQWGLAEAHYLTILEQQAQHAETLKLLATLYLQQKQFKKAIQTFEQLPLMQCIDGPILNGYGLALRGNKQYSEALKWFDRAIAAQANYTKAYYNRGLTLLSLYREDEAIEAFQQSIKLDANYAWAHFYLASLWQKRRQDSQAMPHALAAVRLLPEQAEAWFNLALLQYREHRLDAALHSYNQVIRLAPQHAGAWQNRGVVLNDLKRPQQAIQSYQQALELEPHNTTGLWNQSLLLLMVGDYAQGLRQYESRWQEASFEKARHSQVPRWNSSISLKGKTLLVWDEQGLGDSLQFCRYLKQLANMGGKVVLEVVQPLVSLMQTLHQDIQVYARGHVTEAVHLQIPMMSLALELGTRLENIPAPIPYLFADPLKQQQWSEWLGEKTKPRVGLVWSGRASHYNDFNRSIALTHPLPLCDLSIELHSLQLEYRSEDALTLALQDQIQQHQNRIQDFSDTAALVANMDLVISADTSVAHLAGAMGKPLWILLPYVAEYRWMQDVATSPWYPQARLFRQKKIRDWQGVVVELQQALVQWLSVEWPDN